MSWLSRLFGGAASTKADRPDYLREARALERQGDLDAALTSYRLALRDAPDDTDILQAMAIAYSRTARPEEAIRCYRRALDVDGRLAGAHYGLAFLLLRRPDAGAAAAAAGHLRAFLADAPDDAGAQGHIAHARETLLALDAGAGA